MHRPATPPRTLFYYITFACNLRCRHCYVRSRLGPDTDAPVADVRRELRSARANGVPKLTLLGGEPTLHPDFPAILATSLELGFERVTVDTNGVAGDPAPFGPAPALRVRLSVESSHPTVHDAIRGRANLPRVMKRLEQLLAAGVTVETTSTVTAGNLAHLDPLVGELIDLGVAAINVHFVSLDPVARRAALGLTPQQILSAQETLGALAAQTSVPIRFPRLLVPASGLPAEVARGCTCHRESGDRTLLLPDGQRLGCPLDIAGAAQPTPPGPFRGCPEWRRLLPEGIPPGLAVTCVSWKPDAGG